MMKNNTTDFVRFNLRQRAEHLLILIFFSVLVITGLPQKFYDTAWAEWLILNLGGIDSVRLIHRVAGVIFALMTVGHILLDIINVLLHRIEAEIVPTLKDFTDTITNIKYYFGLTETKPQFGRYDYRQKFEYWGMVMGAVIMCMTGFMLYFPLLFTRYLPGELIAVAKVTHSNEAMMALLVVVVWHLYCAHLNPAVFPGDTSIFTGKISRARMLEEHPLEYERAIKEAKS